MPDADEGWGAPEATTETPPRGAMKAHGELLAYPEVLRAGVPWVWWRPLVGIVLLGTGVFVLAPLVLMPVLAAAVYVQSSLDRRAFTEAFSTATRLEDITPATMLWLNLSLASGTLIAAALVRFLHRLSPRWLVSVRPGVRWRFFLVCLGLSFLALGVSVAASALLPGAAGDVGGTLNRFDAQQVALAAVILLTTPLQAMGEEFAFRGYLMQAFGSLFGIWPALLLTSLLFAGAHGVQNIPLFFDRFAFGLLAGYLVVRSGGLEAGIALHVLNNYVAFGFALLFGDVGSSLTVSSVSWGNVPVTVLQNGLYLLLVVLVARRMGLANRTSRLGAEATAAASAHGSISIGDGSG